MIPGGLSEVKKATPEVQEISEKVKSQLEEQTNESFEEYKAIEYKTQVVAGFIWYIKVQVGEDRYVHIKVFEGLQRNESPKLLGYQTDKNRDDELTAFSP